MNKELAEYLLTSLIENVEAAYLFRYAQGLVTDPYQKQQLQVQEGKAAEQVEQLKADILQEMVG